MAGVQWRSCVISHAGSSPALTCDVFQRWGYWSSERLAENTALLYSGCLLQDRKLGRTRGAADGRASWSRTLWVEHGCGDCELGRLGRLGFTDFYRHHGGTMTRMSTDAETNRSNEWNGFQDIVRVMRVARSALDHISLNGRQGVSVKSASLLRQDAAIYCGSLSWSQGDTQVWGYTRTDLLGSLVVQSISYGRICKRLSWGKFAGRRMRIWLSTSIITGTDTAMCFVVFLWFCRVFPASRVWDCDILFSGVCANITLIITHDHSKLTMKVVQIWRRIGILSLIWC